VLQGTALVLCVTTVYTVPIHFAMDRLAPGILYYRVVACNSINVIFSQCIEEEQIAANSDAL